MKRLFLKIITFLYRKYCRQYADLNPIINEKQYEFTPLMVYDVFPLGNVNKESLKEHCYTEFVRYLMSIDAINVEITTSPYEVDKVIVRTSFKYIIENDYQGDMTKVMF